MKQRIHALQDIDYRKSLPSKKNPYFLSIATGIALGYHAGPRSGAKWTARIMKADGKQNSSIIGAADDDAQADGKNVLSYDDAVICAAERAAALGVPVSLAEMFEPLEVPEIVPRAGNGVETPPPKPAIPHTPLSEDARAHDGLSTALDGLRNIHKALLNNDRRSIRIAIEYLRQSAEGLESILEGDG